MIKSKIPGQHNTNCTVFQSFMKYMTALPIQIPMIKQFIIVTLKTGRIFFADNSDGRR